DQVEMASSTLVVNVMGGLRPETFTVVSANRISGTPKATDGHEWSPFFWQSNHNGRELTLAPNARFDTFAGGGLTDTERNIQKSLQEAWDSGQISDQGALMYGGFARVASADGYRRAMDSVAPEESLSIASVRTLAARTSLNAALSCP